MMRQLLTQPDPPDAGIGRHCTQSAACPFYGYCWQGINGLTIYDISHLSQPKERPLQAAGVLYLADIPTDCALTAAGGGEDVGQP
mgnify:CR=1 FL=1